MGMQWTQTAGEISVHMDSYIDKLEELAGYRSEDPARLLQEDERFNFKSVHAKLR